MSTEPTTYQRSIYQMYPKIFLALLAFANIAFAISTAQYKADGGLTSNGHVISLSSSIAAANLLWIPLASLLAVGIVGVYAWARPNRAPKNQTPLQRPDSFIARYRHIREQDQTVYQSQHG